MLEKNIAFVFPGQGSQSVGMLSDVANAYPLIQKNFQLVSDLLGYDLWQLTQHGPQEKLNETVNTQLAVLTADVSLYQLWRQQQGCQPAMTAGHSLGEYAALVAAEAIELKDAISLVYHRAIFMQNAVLPGQGAMAAIIGLSEEEILQVCQEAQSEGSVEPANFNSPGQTVIGGQIGAVEKAMEIAKVKGAKKAVKLIMSVPSHCSLMRSAAEQLAHLLEGISIKAPSIPVIHNVDALSHSDPEAIKRALVTQLYQPVRWTESIRKMVELGIKTVIECGPGKVLNGLNKRIDENLKLFQLNDLNSLDNLLKIEVTA
jgi:[acyl-carrier-protein] S-malonyltransferase